MPHSMRIVVDLPAPFGPSTPKISPFFTESDTSRTATSEPKRRDRCSVSMIPGMALGPLGFGGRAAAIESDERRHAPVQLLVGIVDAEPDAHDQVHPFALAEEISRRELGLAPAGLDSPPE